MKFLLSVVLRSSVISITSNVSKFNPICIFSNSGQKSFIVFNIIVSSKLTNQFTVTVTKNPNDIWNGSIVGLVIYTN